MKTTRDELFEQAGLGAREDDDGRARLQAVLRSDGALTEHQRRLLLEVYDGLVATSAGASAGRSAGGRGNPRAAGDS